MIITHAVVHYGTTTNIKHLSIRNLKLQETQKSPTPPYTNNTKKLRQMENIPTKVILAIFPISQIFNSNKNQYLLAPMETQKNKALLNTFENNICGHYYGLFCVLFFYLLGFVLGGLLLFLFSFLAYTQ